MQQMTHQQYGKYIDSMSPKSKLLGNMIRAFLVGGLICAIGEGFVQGYAHFGMDVKDAKTAASITLIFLGALLTGLNMYDKLAQWGKAGALVPITGFSNAVVSPAMEFKSEGYVLGVSAKMFSIAGPVLVYGVLASFLYGVVYAIWK